MITIKARDLSTGLSLVVLLATLSTPAVGQQEPSTEEVAKQTQPGAAQEPGASLTEINKQLVNPVSTLWSLTFQQNNYWLTMPANHSERTQNNFLFQPVMPVSLTDNWNLINRPVLPLMNSTPFVNAHGNLDRTTGFGDTTLVELLSPGPSLAGRWLWGLGPTFIFPTASNSHLGQGKWQVGPAGVAGYLGENFALGLFPQQWWSVGGWGSKDTSQLNLQYFAVLFPGDGWSVEMSPNILVDWNARSGNKVTFPVGLGVGKVVKLGPLPVKFAIEGQYMPVHPDAFGQNWNLQIKISPVIPKLIKGNLFGD